MFYDRRGLPISDEEWMKLFETPDYKFLRRDDVQVDGYKPNTFEVITIWMGHDALLGPCSEAFHDGRKPMIFETTVFRHDEEGFARAVGKTYDSVDPQCYATEEEALRGHAQIIADVHEKAGAEARGRQ